MNQDTNERQEQQHILDQIVTPALPPKFHHSDIGRQYEEGEFTTRLDAEVEDILRGSQPVEGPGETAPITLTDDRLTTLKQLTCIALIQDGQVLPLLDIEKTAAPLTSMQKAHLYHAAARILLEAIAAIFEGGGPRVSRDDDEGEGCFVQ